MNLFATRSGLMIAEFITFWDSIPKVMIRSEELPNNWGLVEATYKQLRIKVKAPKLTPTALIPHFIGSML